MSLLEWYVSSRVKYDSITARLSHFFWGEEFSAHRLAFHVLVIVTVVGLFGYDAKSSGDYRHLHFFGALGVIDLGVMLWKWRKKSGT
jgi:hypothetical protein